MLGYHDIVWVMDGYGVFWMWEVVILLMVQKYG